MLFIRALVAFMLLPGIVAFAVPLWMGLSNRRQPFQWLALVPLVLGCAILGWCVRDFYVVGKGTLAPWSPPVTMVRTGPYRVSRNPMYVGVVAILCGWAIGFRSMPIAWYAAIVAIAFHLRVVLFEEPWLDRLDHDGWEIYRGRVPRWLIGRRR